MSKLAIVATISLAVFGGGQPLFAEEAISEPRCVCGLSTGADVSNAGRPAFSDSANTSANERDFRIDDPRETAAVVATPSPLVRCGHRIDLPLANLSGEVDCLWTRTAPRPSS
jgi:hypothetical protein